MLRTKKKQLNLKPNRVLDKRSSRGMLYENEELRLRTIHINDEVDRSQNDIKKLRKENEYLKREIWSLRDECEKLEEVIKKVYSGDPPPPDQLPQYQPRIRKQSTFSSKWDPSGRRGSCLSFSQYSLYADEDSYDQKDDESQYGNTERAPLMRQDSTTSYYTIQTESPEIIEDVKPLILVSDEVSLNESEISDQQQSSPKVHVPHYLQWQMHEPELEAVTEESDNNSTSPNNLSIEKPNLHDPGENIRFIDSSRATSVNSSQEEGGNEYTTANFYNPTIEITPASNSPTPTTTSTSNPSEPTPPPAGNEGVRDGNAGGTAPVPPPIGWVDPSAPSGGATTGALPNNGSSNTPSKGNTANSTKGSYGITSNSGPTQGNAKVMYGTPNTSASTQQGDSPTKGTTQGGQSTKGQYGITTIAGPNSNPNSTSNNNPIDLGCVTLIPAKYESELKISTESPAEKTDSSRRKISQESTASQNIEENKQGSSFSLNSSGIEHSSSAGAGANKKLPKILNTAKSLLNTTNLLPKKKLLFRSEPSLNSLKFEGSDSGGGENSKNRTSLGAYNNGFNQSVEMCGEGPLFPPVQMKATGWNLVDKNLVVGYLDGESGHNGASEILSAQEIIDELEAQFDPTLERIAGVRMLTLPGACGPRRVFISLRTSAGVKLLLEKGLTVRGERVRLVDASQQDAACSTIILSGLPPSFPDVPVISTLNQYGQVVAPLERRAYKGIDIGERQLRMHLVRPLPAILVIGGYQVMTRLVERSAATAQQPSPTIPKPHKPVARAATVNYDGSPPTPSTLSPINAANAVRRKLSVCSAMMDGTNNNSAVNTPKQTPGPKKPVQRPLRSSPGSFSPQQSQEQYVVTMDSNGRAILLARSMSSDPRRISNASKSPTDGSQLSLVDPQHQVPGHAPVTRQQSKYFPGAHQQRMSQCTSNGGGYSVEKKEPLPWCGCWGNGCF